MALSKSETPRPSHRPAKAVFLFPLILVGLLALLAFTACESTQTEEVKDATKEATPTPMPTEADAADCPTDKEQDYFQAFARTTLDVFSGMEEITALSGRVGTNPYLLSDKSFQREVANTLTDMRGEADTLRKLDAPASVDSLQAEVETIADNVYGLSTFFSEGVATADPRALDLALRHMQAIDDIAFSVGTKIQAFCE